MNKKNTLAISPIFATLIILAVITVLFIPIFIWATGSSGQTEDFWEASGLVVTERVVIEEVFINSVDNAFTIYVRNIGKTAVTVDNIFITSPDGNLHPYDSGFDPEPDSVIQGELITVEDLAYGFPIIDGLYIVQVFTTNGVGDSYQVVVE